MEVSRRCPMNSRARTRVFLLLAGLAAAASAVAADPAPCDVLTETDVKNALGSDWLASPALTTDGCTYRGSGGRFVTLTLADDSSASSSLLATRRQMAGDRAKAAAGPGAGAFSLSLPTANAIVFGKGRHVAQIEMGPSAASNSGVLDRLA